MSPRERTWLVTRVVDDAVGLGVLEPLVADRSVTEIMVNGADDVFVERAGRIERVPTRFASEADLYRLIDRVVSSVNRRVDESSPMVDARLPGGERVNVIIPPLALDGPTITIRSWSDCSCTDRVKVRVAEVSVFRMSRSSFTVTAGRKCGKVVRPREMGPKEGGLGE